MWLLFFIWLLCSVSTSFNSWTANFSTNSRLYCVRWGLNFSAIHFPRTHQSLLVFTGQREVFHHIDKLDSNRIEIIYARWSLVAAWFTKCDWHLKEIFHSWHDSMILCLAAMSYLFSHRVNNHRNRNFAFRNFSQDLIVTPHIQLGYHRSASHQPVVTESWALSTTQLTSW